MRCLPRCYRKRCATNRGGPFLGPTKVQNRDGSTFQLCSMRDVPLRRDYARTGQEIRHTTEIRPIRGDHSLVWLARSLLPSLHGKRRSFQDATRTGPHYTRQATAGAVTSSTRCSALPERQIFTPRIAYCRADSKSPKK